MPTLLLSHRFLHYSSDGPIMILLKKIMRNINFPVILFHRQTLERMQKAVCLCWKRTRSCCSTVSRSTKEKLTRRRRRDAIWKMRVNQNAAHVPQSRGLESLFKKWTFLFRFSICFIVSTLKEQLEDMRKISQNSQASNDKIIQLQNQVSSEDTCTARMRRSGIHIKLYTL